MIEEFRAEEKRRSRLTLEERMAEDGREVQCQLEQESTMTILLQPSLPSTSVGKGFGLGIMAKT